MMTQTDRLTYHFAATIAILAFGLVPTGQSLWVKNILSDQSPSRIDLERIERGYYEQILRSGRKLDDSAELASDSKPGAPRFENPFIHQERLTRLVDDIREYVSRPNLKRDVPNRIPWTTNTFGMRDLEYARSKPAGTFRIGFAGDSIGMAWNVGDEEGFEPRLEWTFNDRSTRAGGPQVEVLNFAVPGHGPGQRWFHFSEQAWDFQPDLVIFEGSPADPGWDERRLRALLIHDVGFDAPVYASTLKSAGVVPGQSESFYRASLKPLKWDLLAGVYRKVVEDCRSKGVPCVWVLVPRVGKPMESASHTRILELANQAGFDAVIDGSDAFEGYDMSTLAVGPNDYHPNAQGHHLIAQRLDVLLSRVPAIQRLWMTHAKPIVSKSKPSEWRSGSSRRGAETR